MRTRSTAGDRRATNRATTWLAVAGDVVVTREPGGADPRLWELLADAEVAVGNLEVPLTDRGVPAEKAATHRTGPGAAPLLRRLGFDVMTLANNHALDYGVDGMEDTLTALKEAGLAHVGAGRSLAAALEPALLPTSAGALAVLGLSCSLPPGFAATASRPGVAPIRIQQQVSIDPAIAAEQPGMAPYVSTTAYGPDLAAACAAVGRAREAADIVLVVIHWGVPYGFAALSYGALAEYQPEVGRALLEAGADLVVGHHPHRVDPVEPVEPHGLIAYSVGNFLFHQWERFAPGEGETAGLFPAELPVAPYHSALDAEETLESVLLLLGLTSDGGRIVRFVPTVMKDGDPVIPGPRRCRRILARLTPRGSGGLDIGVVEAGDDPLAGVVVAEVTLGG